MENTQPKAAQTPKLKPHTLTIGTKITITGVQNVVTIADKEVVVALDGNALVLTGSGFMPLHLSLEEGVLVLSGSVACARYARGQGKESFWKKLVR